MKEGSRYKQNRLTDRRTDGQTDGTDNKISEFFLSKSVDINSLGDHEKYVYEYIHFLFQNTKVQ